MTKADKAKSVRIVPGSLFKTKFKPKTKTMSKMSQDC